MDYIAKVKLRHRGAASTYRNILPGERFSDISPDAARALIRAGAIVEAGQEPAGAVGSAVNEAAEAVVKEPMRKGRGRSRAQAVQDDEEPVSESEAADIMRGIVEGE